METVPALVVLPPPLRVTIFCCASSWFHSRSHSGTDRHPVTDSHDPPTICTKDLRVLQPLEIERIAPVFCTAFVDLP